MSKFAVISDGIVTNIIVAESLEVAQETTPLKCVALEGHFTVENAPPVIGDLYNNGTFSKVATE